MANVFGSAFDDRLTGTALADSIFAEDGDDVVRAGAGQDTIFAGMGDDVIRGQSGDDIISSDFDGLNFLVPRPGADWIAGGSGHDQISAAGGNDTLLGETGNDTLQGAGGRDVLNGGAGNDLLFWDARDASVNGERGTDRLMIGGADIDLRSLSAGRIRNIETVDMTGGDGTADRLTLNRAEVLDITSTGNTLTVLGDNRDVVNIVGPFTEVGLSGRFNVYRSGGATLIVETDVTVV
jgi:Ca2+-binding RTX toxin-like protein